MRKPSPIHWAIFAIALALLTVFTVAAIRDRSQPGKPIDETPSNDNSSGTQAVNLSAKKRHEFVHALDKVLAAMDKDHLLDNRQFEVTITEDSEGWNVDVTFLPPMPSGEMAGQLKRNGEVVITPLFQEDLEPNKDARASRVPVVFHQ